MTRPSGCTCSHLDGIHADTCNLIDNPPPETQPRNTYIPPGTRGHYPGPEAIADAINQELRRRINRDPLPPPAATDPAHLDDNPRPGAPAINHDDVQPPPWHPTGTAADFKAAADFMATEDDDIPPPTEAPRVTGTGDLRARRTTRTDDPYGYTDGLRRAFTEALDALRELPTGPQLEAAVLIRERAHQWDINL